MLFEKDGFDIFLNVATLVGDAMAREVEQGVLCDAVVLRECYISAQRSITFHGQGENANHLKQAGHCCFWVAKLKPLTPKVGVAEVAGRLFRGGRPFVMSRLSEEAVPGKKSDVAFPLNEYFALQLGHTIAIEGLSHIADQRRELGDSDGADKIASDIAYHSKRFALVAQRTVKSFRVHNYTARGMATMFEWAYFNGEE